MPNTAVVPARRSVLQPTAGLLILGVDWLFFGADAMTLGLTLILSSIAAFTITSIGVYWIQRKRAGDSAGKAALKALASGAVAGIPTSISGTVVGTLVLVLAGLRRGSNERS
jgi:hypothetical protein